MNDMANHELSLADIPSPEGEWRRIGEFALTFNGYEVYGSFDKCAAVVNARRDGSLAELRTCLFSERRWRHFGEEPDDEAMAYIRAVVEKIRAKVAAGEIA